MPVRLANPADSADISRILVDAFRAFAHLYTPEALAATCISPGEASLRLTEGPIWVAEHEGVIVGTVSLRPEDTQAYLRGMAVVPGVQGLGIGRALLGAAEDFCAWHQIGRIYLKTTPYLDAAIGLYTATGFTRIPDSEGYFFGTPAFSMEKFLNLSTGSNY